MYHEFIELQYTIDVINIRERGLLFYIYFLNMSETMCHDGSLAILIWHNIDVVPRLDSDWITWTTDTP